MKTLLIVYSHTGNNLLLAETLAKELGAEIFILEDKRDLGTREIALDMMLGRKASLKELPSLEGFDLAIFISPIWMFRLPSPIRTAMGALRKEMKDYAFLSLSGGALGPNPDKKIRKQAIRIMRKEPRLFLDISAAEHCRGHKGKEQKGDYLIKDFPQDLENVTSLSVRALGQIII